MTPSSPFCRRFVLNYKYCCSFSFFYLIASDNQLFSLFWQCFQYVLLLPSLFPSVTFIKHHKILRTLSFAWSSGFTYFSSTVRYSLAMSVCTPSHTVKNSWNPWICIFSSHRVIFVEQDVNHSQQQRFSSSYSQGAIYCLSTRTSQNKPLRMPSLVWFQDHVVISLFSGIHRVQYTSAAAKPEASLCQIHIFIEIWSL